MILEDVDCEK